MAPRDAPALGRRQPRAKLLGNLRGDLFLERQCVLDLPLERPAPQLRAVGRVHQLGPDHECGPEALEPPRQHGAHAELGS
jgi:hypothetical protein